MKFNKNKLIDVFAKLGSTLFSFPFGALLCSVLIIFHTPYISLIFSTIFFYVLVPILAYVYLRRIGMITDEKLNFNIQKREERTVYNIIVILGFLTNYILLSMYKIDVAIEISLVLLISFVVYSLVNIVWKMSGHMTQTVTTITSLAFFFPNISLYILLIGYLICIPWVGWSRVYLKHHTWLQVVAGVFIPSFVALVVFTIL